MGKHFRGVEEQSGRRERRDVAAHAGAKQQMWQGIGRQLRPGEPLFGWTIRELLRERLLGRRGHEAAALS